MRKYCKIYHFRNKNYKLDIYFKQYTTKGGKTKFDINIYAIDDNGKSNAQIAKYNVVGDDLLQYTQKHADYILTGV